MPASSCMDFFAQKKKCRTHILKCNAYFIPPYSIEVIRLQDISKTCEVTAVYSSK